MVSDSVTCLHWENNIMYLYVHQEYIAEIRLRYWIVTAVLAVTTLTILSYMPAILDLYLEEKTQSHVSQILIGLHLLNVKVRADYIIFLDIRISWQTLEVMLQQLIPVCTRVNKNIHICNYCICILFCRLKVSQTWGSEDLKFRIWKKISRNFLPPDILCLWLKIRRQ